MIEPQEVEARIRKALPDAEIRVKDLTGTLDHYEVEVVAASLRGLSPIERHRKIYGAFSDVMGGALHALSIKAGVPAG